LEWILINNGSLERSYIYSGAQPMIFHEHETDKDYFYLHDRLGSVRLVIDENGNIKNTYLYEPFGSEVSSETNETVGNPYRFAGYLWDGKVGEYYCNARRQNPQIMRFTSIDPVKGKPFWPLSMHPFLYCGSEPINRIDPTGESYASALVEPIMAGASVHAFAIAVAGVGVAQGNWDILTYGIELEKTILPVMLMAGFRGPLLDDRVPNIIRDYENGVGGNWMGGGGPGWWNKLPKWAAIATGIVILTAHADDVIRGIVDFCNFLKELERGLSEEDAFEPTPGG